MFPLSPALGRLAWRIFLEAEAGAFEMLVSAADGALLLREDHTEEVGSARVWTNNPAASAREVVSFGDGWIPDDGIVTAGKFADSRLDENGDDEADPRTDEELEDGHAKSESQNFDFEAGDGFGFPFEAQAAAVTNAFHFANVARDLFYELGFRERDGNFQVDNGENGGVVGDPVRINVHSGAVRNNAGFLTRPEGEPAHMRVGVFTAEDGFRDAAFDGDILLHECTHGVTARLVGGPENVGCLDDGPQPDALAPWPSAGFTGARFQVRIIDGAGGETLHGFFLRSEALLELGETVTVSGRLGSGGYLYFNVPPGTEALQVRMRGDGTLDADEGDVGLSLFDPSFRLANGSVAVDLEGTATVGGVAAPVSFAGLTPGFVGLSQVSFTVSADSSGFSHLLFRVEEEASPPVELNVDAAP